MDCALPGFSGHGILQARILVWAAISFSKGSSQLRDWTQVTCTAGRFFIIWATKEATRVCVCVCVWVWVWVCGCVGVWGCVCVCIIICASDTLLEVQNLGLNKDLQNEKIYRLGSIKYPLHGSCAFNSCLRFHDELWPSLSEGCFFVTYNSY